MAKKILQDVVFQKKKRIIAMPSRHKKEKDISKIAEEKLNEVKKEAEKIEKKIEQAAMKSAEKGFFGKKRNWYGKKTVWLGTALAAGAAAIIFAAGTVFARASIEVVPKTSSVAVNAQFTAKKGGTLPFEIMMVKGSETRSIKATGTKYVERKASGQIVIYNTYSKFIQKLVKNTRFEATGGKIYKIANDIMVPGMHEKDGELVPGSIEATVYAREPGQAYNSGLTDFTVPGFKGDPRYAKFYARSKTEITGGFIGNAPVASEKDFAQAKAAIEASLKDDLLHDANSQVPDGYILYGGSIKINFEETRDISDDPKSVVLKENGVLLGVLLKKEPFLSELAKYITSSSKETMPFTINSPESLKFSFQSGTASLGAETKETAFSLSGNTGITYSINKNDIIKDLAGKNKGDFQNILSRHKAVYKARILSLQPFWSSVFPAKEGKITVSVAAN